MKISLRTHLLAAVMLVAIAACSTLGLPSADTFNQKVAVAQGSVTQIRVSATQLLNTKAIGVTDAENVLKQTDAAAEGIAVSRTLYTQVCPATAPQPCTSPAASNRLAVATGILTVLQTYLAAQSAAK